MGQGGFHDSLWQSTAVPAIGTGPLSGPADADVVIIGGGLTGFSAALHLALNGVVPIVLEANEIGFGASGRSGGQVNLGLNDGPYALRQRFGGKVADRLTQFVIATPNNLFKLIKEHGLDCDPVQNGLIFAAKTAKRLDDMANLVAQYRAHGARCEILGEAALRDQTGAEGFLGGMRFDGCGSVQPLSLTRELARVAKQAGAKIYTHSPVTGLGRQGKIWRVATKSAEVTARSVLICTNGYTDAAMCGLERALIPVRSIQAATAPLADEVRAALLPNQVTFVDKRRLVLYCRYDRDGRLCIGNRGPLRDHFKIEDFAELKRQARAVFPQLDDVQFDFHWGGRVAITRDHLPFFTALGVGLFAGMGYNGRGVGMGTMMGQLLADTVLRGPDYAPPLPLTRPKEYPLHGFYPLGVWLRNLWASAWQALENRQAG